MSDYIVYMHINKINNKKYIGITKQKPEQRWGLDGKRYISCPKFFNAIQKYGWDNFDHQIIKSHLSQQDAETLEKMLISQYNTQNEEYGYNIKDGGLSSEIMPETKKKISESLKGHKHTGKALENMRKGFAKRRSHPHTEDFRRYMREKMKGHITSEETKLKQSQHCRKKVLCVELNIVYPSQKEAAKAFNISNKSISSVICGRSKTAAGYHWILVDDSTCGTTIESAALAGSE